MWRAMQCFGCSELTLQLIALIKFIKVVKIFFVDIIKHITEHGNIKNGHKTQTTLNIWRDELNKQSGVHSKCPVKENCWTTRSFLLERLLINAGWSGTSVTVSWLLQMKQIPHPYCSNFSKKQYMHEFSVLYFRELFPLNMSDYCIFSKKS